MLEDLLKLDWGSLKTVTGSARLVPEALVGLLSEDDEVVEAAYWQLENCVVVQGTLSESAEYLADFLEEALLVAKYKGSITELLFQIGNGNSTDARLQESCFKKVVSVFERSLGAAQISGTKWESVIRRDLKDLLELHKKV